MRPRQRPRESIGTGADVGRDRRVDHVVPSYTNDAGSPRWLTAAEISAAARTALDEKQQYVIAGQIAHSFQRFPEVYGNPDQQVFETLEQFSQHLPVTVCPRPAGFIRW